MHHAKNFIRRNALAFFRLSHPILIRLKR